MRGSLKFYKMKILSYLIVSLFCFSSTNDLVLEEPTPLNAGDLVDVVLEFEDGCIHEYQSTFNNLLPNIEVGGLVRCSYSFPDGTCYAEAETCQEAYARFAWCACFIGHVYFCNRAFSPPDFSS